MLQWQLWILHDFALLAATTLHLRFSWFSQVCQLELGTTLFPKTLQYFNCFYEIVAKLPWLHRPVVVHYGSFVTYANSCHLDQHMQGPEGLRIILQARKLIQPNMLCAYDVTEPWNQQTCPVGWIWGFCGLACAEAPFRDVVGEVDEARRRKGSSPCDTVDSVQEPGHEPRIHEGWSVVSLITLWLDVLWHIDEPYTSKPIYPNRTWLLYASLRYLHSFDMPNGPIFVYAWHPGRLPSRRVGTWTSQACPRTFVRNTWLRIWRCCGMN